MTFGRICGQQLCLASSKSLRYKKLCAPACLCCNQTTKHWGQTGLLPLQTLDACPVVKHLRNGKTLRNFEAGTQVQLEAYRVGWVKVHEQGDRVDAKARQQEI